MLKKEDKKETLVVRISNSVPRAGVEPARIAPLVFETSASTDSAIWAYTTAKLINCLVNAKFYSKKKNSPASVYFKNFISYLAVVAQARHFPLTSQLAVAHMS